MESSVDAIVWESPRLAFRRLTAADAERLWRLDDDPEVMRHISGGRPTPKWVIERRILPGFIASYQPPGFGVWGAIAKDCRDFAGWCSLRPDADDPTAGRLGYRLHRAFWGRGLATEAVHGLLRRAFEEMALRRVSAAAYEYNFASRRVMEKAGMRFVRRFRLTGGTLAAADTFDGSGAEVWAGDEVEYAAERAWWRAED